MSTPDSIFFYLDRPLTPEELSSMHMKQQENYEEFLTKEKNEDSDK